MEGGGVRRACARCHIQRRKCQDCIFAPHFPLDKQDNFNTVHKVFSAHNVERMLKGLMEDQQADAVRSMVYEANARKRDPVNGCYREIMSLELLVQELQNLLTSLKLDNQTLQGQVTALKQENQTFQRQVTALKQENQTLQDQLTYYKEDLRVLLRVAGPTATQGPA